ncbi:alpha/beta hydrolase [Melaminivora jejuensis]|uniref:alpha/beta fold hydrolase n=1 Tax=Melaminivora jejuensis TaxID=1267217 RepID=UPI001AE0AEA1|nr:alpha/beta hydrolase [Melaminivora jejuensis]UHJ65138.1 alpha/beta fold hydrolase [Melaminivora jejuensis]
MSPVSDNPEVARSITAAGIRTNYHDLGSGAPVLLIHGSGPGVSAWANWRLLMAPLAERARVIAPDMAGFGYSERPAGFAYGMDAWVRQAVGLLDALGIARADLVGNSFGGGLALALAIRHPERVRRLVLMGSVGVPFELTPGLDAVWGYEPSLAAMRALLDIFAFDRSRVTDELARLRYEASIRPGFQESFAAMFPAPRQRWVDALASPEADIRRIPHETLVVHGREDRVIPLANAYRLTELLPRVQLHVYGQCGHWTQIEHAARFARLVGDFLAEADPQEPHPLIPTASPANKTHGH